jgi:predicted O-methyltransferase YrrM
VRCARLHRVPPAHHNKMIEEILKNAKESTYDFRVTAYPEDPLHHLFEEWVPYYRMKWAIARVLQPSSILEIGVRFGYSAMAFLHAVPSARYVGIDINAESFGGSVGAIEWAQRATAPYQTDFIIADSTKMKRFPGDRFDLIHIDGQQDGVATLHDLVLASSQANYILVDGYFWSRQNFFSASEFLYQYRDAIEYYQVIPGYAGELLIRVKSQRFAVTDQPIEASSTLRDAYTEQYYLSNCEGYEAFKRTLGAKLEDIRLEVIARLCRTVSSGRALDLGSGRGELSMELARQGFRVTAIDYSPDAVKIAREAISRSPQLSSSIFLQCTDVNSAVLQGPYRVAVAADLVEHMPPSELEQLYQKTANNLDQDGLFIVHTYPNLWYYQYEYARRLRLATQIGAYLPAEPRTRYELLMHINEQSPRVLKRQLRKYFRHVLVWFGSPSQPGENLARKFRIGELRAAPDLFAIASHKPIPVSKLLAQLRMDALPVPILRKVELKVRSFLSRMRTGARQMIAVELRNGTKVNLRSLPPYPIHLSYHWVTMDGHYEMFGGHRTQLRPDSMAGSSVSYEMSVTSPSKPGIYWLRVTLVQESIRWFDQSPTSLYHDVQIGCDR